ncbi:TPA: zinc ribbon domain-containing protein [Legionella pneumophila]|nr:zinc ribbon domain-containing protein [Legionella pneumophila]MDW8878390.1 zinc ribbon domain-containing protein [Legionella pneumophila subsp. fraseri]MDW8961282.1 zinc ribbon domain-containing protein [Legionella pneumophila subsp. fraseri]MDW9034714.1 zinc ribbon domain-containing protein [Legionella pneumophila subsp. fraseri]MDW9037610.1 zinc ribbon domain-containing protein [Legionella pneumophila subsp. fraseri]MDW9040835.1 zinc ribbon domain-containing protein [Legionella pneumophil
MGFLKRIFGNGLSGHHGGYRNSHHGQRNDYREDSANVSRGKMNCPRCQTSLTPGMRFCNECGSSLESALCICGAVIAIGAKFCGQCGKSL